MRSPENRPTGPVRRRERRGQWVALSFALHLAVLLLHLLRLPEQVTPPEPIPDGRGSPASVAMIADVGTAEGVKLPTPSFAPASVSPGDAPSAAPSPPMPPPAPAEAITAPPTPPAVPTPLAEIPPPAPTTAPPRAPRRRSSRETRFPPRPHAR